jgi:hypothetical protein
MLGVSAEKSCCHGVRTKGKKKYEGRLKELILATLTERHHRANMQMVHKIMRAESRLTPRDMV